MSPRLARLASLGWVLLAPLALWTGFADPVETPKRLVFAVLAAAAWGAACADPARRVRLAAHPLTRPLLGLSLATAMSAACSGSPRVAWAGEEGSWAGASQQLAVWLGALAIAAPAGAEGVRRGAAGLVGLGVASLAYAAAQAAGADPMPWDAASVNRYWLFATLGNPVHLAAVLVAAAFAAGAAFRPGSRAGGVARIALVAGALATRQRSAWVALAAGGLVWLVARRPRRATGASPRFAGAAVAVGAALAVALTVRATEGSRLLGIGRLGSRPHIWAGVGRIWRDAPLLGVGPDLIHDAFPRHATYAFFTADPPVIRGEDVDLRLPGSAHAEPLQMAATVGVLGAGCWLWALAAAARAGGAAGLLPAAAALLGAQLINPASAATTALLWWLLVAGAARRQAGRPAPGGRGVTAGGAVLVVASLVTGWRGAVAQAHLREAGRLGWTGDRAGLADHLRRWDAAAAAWQPRAALADAARWRMLAGSGAAPDGRARAAALLARARAGDPPGLFPLCAAADLELEAGRAGDRDALRRAEADLRRAIGLAPAVASLHADLARVLEAAGRRAEARQETAEGVVRDPAGVFRPSPAR